MKQISNFKLNGSISIEKSFMALPLLLSFFLFACNAKQDPLANASEQVKKGVPPQTELLVVEKAMPKEALQIYAPSLVQGAVGKPLEIKIEGRVLIPEVGFELSIENIQQFKGASFDAATGVFKWTPPADFIGQSKPNALAEVIVKLSTKPSETGYAISGEQKKIAIVVENAFEKPVVNSVTTQSSYAAGGTYQLPITLTVDQIGLLEDFFLYFGACQFEGQIHNSLSYSLSDFTYDTQKKVINGKVNLSLYNNSYAYRPGEYCFNGYVGTRFGQKSDPYRVSLKLSAETPRTLSTLKSIKIKKGETGIFNFAIFDPYQIGTVALLSKDDPAKEFPGSELACSSETSRSVLICRLVLNASTTDVGEYELRLQTRNSQLTGGNRPVIDEHTLYVEVKETL